MTVLDYAKPSVPRLRWWHWIGTFVAGAGVGFVCSGKMYDLILPLLARDRQVTVSDIYEPFRQYMIFAAASSLSGILIAVVAILAADGRANWLVVWATIYGAVFLIGAIGGVAYERMMWRAGQYVSLSDVPVLAAPIAGSIAVTCVAVVVGIRRRMAKP